MGHFVFCRRRFRWKSRRRWTLRSQWLLMNARQEKRQTKRRDAAWSSRCVGLSDRRKCLRNCRVSEPRAVATGLSQRKVEPIGRRAWRPRSQLGRPYLESFKVRVILISGARGWSARVKLDSTGMQSADLVSAREKAW